MAVETGKVFKKNKQKVLNEQGEQQKLKEMMIPKKHKRVYQKIKRGTKKKVREVGINFFRLRFFDLFIQ